MAGVRVTHTFQVVDPGDPGGGIGSGHGDGIPLTPPRRQMPPGFPPVALYRLTFAMSTGLVELAAEIERLPDRQAAGLRQFVLGVKQAGRTDLARITIRMEPTVQDLRTSRGLPLAMVRPREVAVELE